jgi:hypothetical protein
MADSPMNAVEHEGTMVEKALSQPLGMTYTGTATVKIPLLGAGCWRRLRRMTFDSIA